jgi:hypothetical protein
MGVLAFLFKLFLIVIMCLALEEIGTVILILIWMSNQLKISKLEKLNQVNQVEQEID